MKLLTQAQSEAAKQTATALTTKLFAMAPHPLLKAAAVLLGLAAHVEVTRRTAVSDVQAQKPKAAEEVVDAEVVKP